MEQLWCRICHHLQNDDQFQRLYKALCTIKSGMINTVDKNNLFSYRISPYIS